ncbi:MAG TPA: CHRD domain-containing protein [Noviherbaspirillum sp.]
MLSLDIRTLLSRCFLLLPITVLASCGGGGNDVPWRAFSTTLAGGQEVPPNSSIGTAIGVITVNRDNNIMYASVVVNGVNETAVYLQEGQPGINGPIVFSLYREASSGVWIASAALSATQWGSLRAGNYYFNVLSTTFPGGELRGQLFRQPPAPEQLNLLQRLRSQSPQIDRQLDAIRQIEEGGDWHHSGAGIGISIGF